MTLKEARRRKGLTQVELSTLSGVTQTAISALEVGRSHSPTWETVAKLSKALRVKPEVLFPVDDETAVAS